MKRKEYREKIYQFIDYLHENTGVFQSDYPVIDEIAGLNNTYKGAMRSYDKKKWEKSTGAEINRLYGTLKCNAIPETAKQMGLYQRDTVELKNNFNGNSENDPNFDDTEFVRLTETKIKYLEFCQTIDIDKLSLGMFFHDLTIGLANLFARFVDVSDMVERFKITKFDLDEGIDPPKKPIPEIPEKNPVNEKHSIPEELTTEKATALFKRTIEAGFMKEDFSFIGTRTQMAYWVIRAAEHLGIKYKWKVFETFFRVKYLSQANNRTKETRGMVTDQNKIDTIFI